LWKCYFAQYTHPFVSTPLLWHQETLDAVMLSVQGMNNVSQPGALQYAEQWRANVSLALAAVKAPHAVFAPACYWHCSSESSQFESITINDDLSDQTALHAFMFNNQSFAAIDACEGWSCSSGCPSSVHAQRHTQELLSRL